MTSESEKPTDRELAYLAGRGMAYRLMLTVCLKEIGEELTDTERRVVQLTNERDETRQALRRVCEEHGDNDWDDRLHLADVVDKHLARHLGERES